MASLIIDTKELQERLIIWGASPDGLVNPETGMPSGVLNRATVDAVKAFGKQLRIPVANIYVASAIEGLKTEVQPSQIVEKLMEPPSALSPDYIVQDMNEGAEAAVKDLTIPVKDTLTVLAKTVADNIPRARIYALKVSQLSKEGKATPPVVEAYKNWYTSASKLQTMLVKRLRNPLTRGLFERKLKKAGMDAAATISALTSGPLAVAKAAPAGTALEGFFIPLIWLAVAGTGVAGIAAWKGADILDAWKGVQQEETNRKILECQLDPKCDSSKLDPLLRHRENLQNKTSWPWFLGGAAIAALGLGIYHQRDRVRKILPVR
jgi:hypothetical protein